MPLSLREVSNALSSLQTMTTATSFFLFVSLIVTIIVGSIALQNTEDIQTRLSRDEALIRDLENCTCTGPEGPPGPPGINGKSSLRSHSLTL